MHQKEVLAVCLGSAIINEDEATLSAVAQSLAELPKTSISFVWKRLSSILPQESIAWLRETLSSQEE